MATGSAGNKNLTGNFPDSMWQVPNGLAFLDGPAELLKIEGRERWRNGAAA